MKDSFASSKFKLNLLPRIWELASPLVPNRHQKPKGRKQRTFCWLPLLGNLVLLELRAGGKLHIAPSCPGPSKLQNPVVNRFISWVTGQFMLQMTESGMDGLADLGFFALCDVLPVSQLKWHLAVVSRTSGPTSLEEVKRNRDPPFKFMTKASLVAKACPNPQNMTNFYLSTSYVVYSQQFDCTLYSTVRSMINLQWILSF